MGTPDEAETKKMRAEPFKFSGLESNISEIESLSPEDEFFVRAQRGDIEGEQIGCESRILDEICSAACDCHGDSCCC
jgi:hypothetical protein